METIRTRKMNLMLQLISIFLNFKTVTSLYNLYLVLTVSMPRK